MNSAKWMAFAAAVLWLASAGCPQREGAAPNAPPPPAPPPAAPPGQAAPPGPAAPGPAMPPGQPTPTPGQAPPPDQAAPPGSAAAQPSSAGGPADAARGKQVYLQYCASCHGQSGQGDGPQSATLNPRPANHTDGNRMNPLTDENLHQVISQGGASVGKSPLMAPWGGILSEAQIRDVIAYIRSLAKPPYPGKH